MKTLLLIAFILAPALSNAQMLSRAAPLGSTKAEIRNTQLPDPVGYISNSLCPSGQAKSSGCQGGGCCVPEKTNPK